jgi:hypothetical protein
MQEVQLCTVPEHEAQLGLQGWQLPLIDVKPDPQLATQLPLETIFDEH